MPCSSERIDEVKRKLRSLKKLEVKIRFGGTFRAANFKDNSIEKPEKAVLVWDTFFHLDRIAHGRYRYTAEDVASMNKEEYRNMLDEFFFRVYYQYYVENGITASHLYNPEILGWMGLPLDAGAEDIKKKFRELAKKYHPDTGGDEKRFIELMENYQKLLE